MEDHLSSELATFTLFDGSPGGIAYSYMLEGYREVAHLTEDDLYATELMVLFRVLRFLGKEVDESSRDFWCRTIRKRLGDIAGAER